MSAKTPPPTDLLGDPWVEPRDPRGRKRHKRSTEIAEKVGLLRAADMTVEDIAARIGLSEPTLRKYYFRELTADAAGKAVVPITNLLRRPTVNGGAVELAKPMVEGLVPAGQSAKLSTLSALGLQFTIEERD